MLLCELNREYRNDLYYNNEFSEKKWFVISTKRTDGPFRDEQAADVFIAGRKDLINPKKLMK